MEKLKQVLEDNLSVKITHYGNDSPAAADRLSWITVMTATCLVIVQENLTKTSFLKKYYF